MNDTPGSHSQSAATNVSRTAVPFAPTLEQNISMAGSPPSELAVEEMVSLARLQHDEVEQHVASAIDHIMANEIPALVRKTVQESITNMKRALLPELIAAANIGKIKDEVIQSIMEIMAAQMAAGQAVNMETPQQTPHTRDKLQVAQGQQYQLALQRVNWPRHAMFMQASRWAAQWQLMVS